MVKIFYRIFIRYQLTCSEYSSDFVFPTVGMWWGLCPSRAVMGCGNIIGLSRTNLFTMPNGPVSNGILKMDIFVLELDFFGVLNSKVIWKLDIIKSGFRICLVFRRLSFGWLPYTVGIWNTTIWNPVTFEIRTFWKSDFKWSRFQMVRLWLWL